MFGLSSLAETPIAALLVSVAPTPVVAVDYGDGDKQRKKHWKRERLRNERRRRQIIEAYEQLVEGKPALAASIVAPYMAPYIEQPLRVPHAVDFTALLANVERAQRILDERQELEDEAAILRLL